MSTLKKPGKILKFIYATVLRPFIVKNLNVPNVDWDNRLIEWLDKLFDYEQ
jgi:hypothetical protein